MRLRLKKSGFSVCVQKCYCSLIGFPFIIIGSLDEFYQLALCVSSIRWLLHSFSIIFFFLLVAMINSNICTMYIYLTYMFGTCVLTEHINPIREKSEAKSIKALNSLGENSTVLSSFFFFFLKLTAPRSVHYIIALSQ